MKTNMELPIIKIGNSKGIRLSKTLLAQYQIQDKVEIILDEEGIIIKPIKQIRADWDKAFKEMHKNGDDKLLMDDFFEDESLEEWD